MHKSALFLGIGLVVGLAIGLMLTPLAVTDGHVGIALWLELLQRVCTSIGGLGTFVAIFFVARQFHLLQVQFKLVQKTTKASLDGQVYSRLDSFNRFIVEHDVEYDLLNKPFVEIQPNDRRYKLHHLCDIGFTFYEEIFKHHMRYKLVESEDWDEWQQNMAHFFSKPYVRGYWPTVANRYADSFRTSVNELIAGMPRLD